jgi:outer membrane protein assembly factor BamE (lipoprotein component of BamABCDE complex)
MKTIKAIALSVVFLGLAICLWGCEARRYTEGNVFEASDINQIVKGKTTTADLMNIFGTPYSKTAQADGGEQWYYYCSHQYDSVGMVPFGAVSTDQRQKNDLVISVSKEKVVVDYKLVGGAQVTHTTETFGSAPSIAFSQTYGEATGTIVSVLPAVANGHLDGVYIRLRDQPSVTLTVPIADAAKWGIVTGSVASNGLQGQAVDGNGEIRGNGIIGYGRTGTFSFTTNSQPPGDKHVTSIKWDQNR